MFKNLLFCCTLLLIPACAWDDPSTPPRPQAVATSPAANIGAAVGNVKSSQAHTAVIRDLAIEAEKTGLPPNSNEAREIKTRAVLVEGLLVQTRVDLGKAESQANDLSKERDQYLKNWQSSDKELSTSKAKLNELVGQLKVVVKQRNILAAILSVVIILGIAWVVLRLYGARRLF